MGIQSIPQELILMVGENLSIEDLNNFLCTCRGLSKLLTPRLHELGLQNVGSLSALQWAAKHGYEPLVKLAISKGAKVNEITKCESKFTALHLAASNSSTNPQIIHTLVKHGAEVDAKSSDHCTPLHILMGLKNWTSVEKGKLLGSLLQCGADVHAKDKLGDTPAHIAANKEDIKSLNQLIHAGFDVSMKGAGGDTVLHRAARGSGRGMKFLLDLEAGRSIINVQNKKGATPLHIAAGKCDRVKVEMLLKCGANDDLEDSRGRTAAELALLRGGIM